MSEHLLFLIVGLGLGAAYAGLGMGIVVIHRGTGVINVAHGALVMWAPYTFDELVERGRLVLPVGTVRLGEDLGTVPSMALAVGVVILLAAVLHLVVFRSLRDAPPLAGVAASVGVLITSQALILIRFGSGQRQLSAILPTNRWQLGDLTFARDRILLALVALGLAGALVAHSRFTRVGLATRAAAAHPLGASLLGRSPNVLALLSWMIGAGTSAVLVLLVVPSIGLNAVNLTLFVVPGLAAALAGRLGSIGVTCAAGLLLGAVQAEISHLATATWWPRWASVGTAEAVPFVVIVVLLIAVGDSLPTRESPVAPTLPIVRRSPIRPAFVALAVGAGVVALVVTHGTIRLGVINSMIAAVVALSLVVLTGLLGQISLAQAAFAGSSGFALSRFAEGASLPLGLALVGAILVAGALGVLVGLPALRIRGAQLAVVTLAAAVAIERFVFRNPALSPPSGNLIPHPEVLGLDLAVRRGTELARLPFGLMVLAVLTVVALGVAELARSATGRALLAVRCNERAAIAAGLSVTRLKLVAFGVSSSIAGVGGALIGFSRGQLSVDSFTVLTGLSFLAFAYLGGITSVTGALIAGTFAPLGIGYTVGERFLDLGRYYTLAAGMLLVVTALLNPSGIAGKMHADLERLRRRRAPQFDLPTESSAERREVAGVR